MTVIRRNDYADRARAFRTSANTEREAGDLARATKLEELAVRCEHAHATQPWRTAADLRFDADDCCIECHEHLSNSHQPHCIYGDVSHATA